MTIHILAVTLLLSTAVFSSQAGVNDPAAGHLDPSAINLPEFKMEGTIVEDFTKVMMLTKTSGGIVSIDDRCPIGSRSTFSIDSGTSLSRSLDIIASDARAGWQINDEVVNVLPADSIPALLLVGIHRFEWDRAGSVNRAVGQLTGLSEVTQGAVELGLKPELFQHTLGAMCIRNCPKKPDPIMEVEEDVSLLTILNHIVRSHRGATWAYSQFHCGDEPTFTISSEE